MSERIVETGAELYRAMKVRGLELRSGRAGRDYEVYSSLQSLLKCPPEKQLQGYLDKNQDITASVFLRAFRTVAQPFAQMFEEIWTFLSSAAASLANESIRVRVGYPDAPGGIDLDLEAFRRFAEQASRTSRSVIWSAPQLHSLIRQGQELQLSLGVDAGFVQYGSGPRYNPFKPYALAQSAPNLPSAFTKVYSGLQDAIEAASHHGPKDGATAWLNPIGIALTDTLPSWAYVLEHSADLSEDAARHFADWFDGEFSQVQEEEDSAGRSDPLDEIDLPFWRHRWHTFEIWISVVFLRSLDRLRLAPRLRLVDGYLPIDGYASATLADLSCRDHKSARVAIQVQTKIPGLNQAIRPDLQILAESTAGAEDSLLVVECKQRAKMTAQHLQDVAKRYRAGCMRASGIIVVNYDAPGLAQPDVVGSYSLESVRPNRVREFEDCLRERIEEAGLKPLPRIVILVDCSASMEASYEGADIKEALRAVLGDPRIKVSGFADGLLAERPRLDARGEVVLPPIKGPTAIAAAITAMITDCGWMPDLLVIVSDGDYDRAPILKNLPEIIECNPGDFPTHVGSILQRLRAPPPSPAL